ncbi:MAG: type I secretion system permease/ATPase [Limnohabitans sp.]|nr:type I secretion system permease/ATPase [Limnohabitans sp.]
MKSPLSAAQSEIAAALRQFKGIFKTVAVFSMAINLLMLVPSIYMLQVYDSVLTSRNLMTLAMLSLITALFYAIISGLEWVRSQVLIRVGAQVDALLSERIYTAAFEQNLKKNNFQAGQALTDLTTLRQFVTGQGLFAFFDVPWFPIYLAVIFLFDFWLGVFSLVGTAVLIALAWANDRVSSKPLSEASQLALVSGAMATNNLRNAEVIESMGMLPNLRARWHQLHQQFLAQQAIASDKASVVTAVTKLFRLTLQSYILGLGAWLVIEGRLTPGMMIAGSILMGRALSPVEQLITVWKQVSGVKTAWQRLDQLLQQNPARKTGMPLPAPTGQLSIENVTAAPPGGQVAVLKGVQLSLAAGEVLAIIGPSASGKSSLARLMVGIWPAQVGKVRLDGADLYQWNKDALGQHLGYLPQDIELFAGTVAENIARFGEVDSEKVIAAAQLAGVHEMVLRLPKGYDTPIGEGGAGLSGGQQQRIGLARALYGQPALIVLDEPNSNLDDAGEAALIQAIRELKALRRSVVLITHRMPILTISDKLLVLNEGAVQGFGPTQQILGALAQARQQAAAQRAPAAPAA